MKKFIDFTKKIWIEEITEDEAGTLLNHKINYNQKKKSAMETIADLLCEIRSQSNRELNTPLQMQIHRPSR